MTETMKKELQYYTKRGAAKYNDRCFKLGKHAGMNKYEARRFATKALKQVILLAENEKSPD